MKKRQRKYSLEYKQKAIELSYSLGNVKAVCEELDIPISVLNRWRREHREYGFNSFPGRGMDLRQKSGQIVASYATKF